MRHAIWLPGSRLLLLWAAQLEGIILQRPPPKEKRIGTMICCMPRSRVRFPGRQASGTEQEPAPRRPAAAAGGAWGGAGRPLLAAAITRSRRCSRQPDHQTSTGGPGKALRGKGRGGGCGLGLGERWGRLQGSGNTSSLLEQHYEPAARTGRAACRRAVDSIAAWGPVRSLGAACTVQRARKA